MKNKKIIIAGGSGFIGQYLAAYFGKENEVVILGRQSGDSHNNSCRQQVVKGSGEYPLRYVQWSGKEIEKKWAAELNGAHLVINLAGKSVNCRYHSRQKREIITSRVHTTQAIGEAIRQAKQPPLVWINAASATIYRNAAEKPNDEYTGEISDRKKDNMPYNFIDELRYRKNRVVTAWRYGKGSEEYKALALDFSVQVCKAWEKTFFSQHTPATRKIALRTAITLGEGGVMIPYLNLCKCGLGGRHGHGRQMFSWVHIEDVAGMTGWLYETGDAEGIYNCVAPNAVSNNDFMKTIRQTCGCKLGLPAPSWLLEAGAFLIRTETELMLKSRWVIPARAMQEGFVFKYPVLEKAIQQIISRMPRSRYRLF